MARVTINKGGITTEVHRGELDWYLRNGWTEGAIPAAEPESTPEPEAVAPAEEADEVPAKKKATKKE